MIVTFNLEDLEHGIVLDALNEYFNTAITQLDNGYAVTAIGDKRPLGDIEKQLLDKRVELVKPLIHKIERAGY